MGAAAREYTGTGRVHPYPPDRALGSGRVVERHWYGVDGPQNPEFC
jgi:hypothetical protein